jgi:hypothetical protein
MGKVKNTNFLSTVSSLSGSASEKLNRKNQFCIDVGKVGDRFINFSVWANLENCNAISWISDQCCILGMLNPKQIVGNRIKFQGWVSWEPVGEDLPNSSEKMKLARFISELPSSSFIPELKTVDQLIEWVKTKNCCLLLAKLFIAGYGSIPDNPLQTMIDSGEINMRYYNSMLLSANLYTNLWELILFKHRLLKEQFNYQGWGFPFKHHRLLMEEIIRASVEGEFSNILKKRYVAKAQDYRIIAELGKRNQNGTLSCKERDLLTNLTINHSEPNEWFNRLIAVAELLSGDRFIKAKVDTHHAIMTAIATRQIQEAKRPELRACQGETSVTWVDGVKTPGIQPDWKSDYKS